MVLCLRMTELAVSASRAPELAVGGQECDTHRGAGTIAVPGGALVREPIDVTCSVGVGGSGIATLDPVDEDKGKLPWLPWLLPTWPPLR